MSFIARSVLLLAAFFAASSVQAAPPMTVLPEGQVSSLSAPSPAPEPVFADDFAPAATEPIIMEQDTPAPVADLVPAAVSDAPSSGPAAYYRAEYYDIPAPLASSDSMSSKAGGSCMSGLVQAGGSSTLRIAVGDIISDRLSSWLGGHGYSLTWEAPLYRADGSLVLDKGFDGTLRAVKDALEAHGAKLDVTVYENCAVRVVGAK